MKKILATLFTIALLTSTISSVFAVSAVKSPFKDLFRSHPNFEAIMGLYTRGIMEGNPDGTVEPIKLVDRAAAAKLITLGLGIETKATSGGFSDCPDGVWFAKFVGELKARGVIEGYEQGKFYRPTENINLVGVLKILYEASDTEVPSGPFDEKASVDSIAGAWFEKYLHLALTQGIIELDNNGNSYPNQDITRGELSEIMHRLTLIRENNVETFNEVKDEETIEEDEEENEPEEVTLEDLESLPTLDSSGNLTTAVVEDGTLKVMIKDLKFFGEETIVAVGTTVRWINQDSMPHTITSVGDKGPLQSEVLNQGGSYLFTFDKESSFEYYCTVHPSMKGKIIVKPAGQVPTI